ncbi:hypothetical protein O6H91_23G031400 [Diphasiastrum complanatum]|uniref:Uncharacterized protein n=1 Tax=Diphasiastrum complanatum TaxID=34168 RepID=A0ACC2AAM5_DIPCM|nr:hypothetical protein O6H91_23G031400 [Diphasiastrum complanatum]
MAMKAAATSSPGAVQATNDDASASKLSCVKKGYILDDFVHFFVKRPIKRAPLINRGYYARWAAIRKLLLQFLDSVGPKQILSLGAGFDTTYFQLEEEGRGEVKYVELDFLEVTSRKATIIASREQLQKKVESLGTISPERGEIHSKHYMLLPVDLRDINSLEKAFECAQLDISVPTFILSECVLIYLDPDVSRAVVNWAAQKFNTAVFVVYEQYSPEDAFGQQMIKNLESRGCPLLGIHDTPSLEAKRERFTKNGWPRAVALNMDEIYRSEIDPIDRRRIERLEIFDEFEEWHMMQEHYCLAYGIKDATGMFDNFGFGVR